MLQNLGGGWIELVDDKNKRCYQNFIKTEALLQFCKRLLNIR